MHPRTVKTGRHQIRLFGRLVCSFRFSSLFLCLCIFQKCTDGESNLLFFGIDIQNLCINNLSDFIFGVIRAVGLILLGWGIVQIGLSFQSHDPSQRSNGFLTLAGGVIVTFAKEILSLITG